jgi:hypothetical protein
MISFDICVCSVCLSCLVLTFPLYNSGPKSRLFYCAQDQDSYIRRRILELLCKNGVQGVKFCLKTTPAVAAAAGTNTDAALYSSDEAREAATDDDIADREVEGRGAASAPALSQSVAVRRLFSGLPQRMENTLCRLKVVCT